ncbi:MAG: peptidylprolyl isomerase [Flavobacteriales bacterium]|nr:peptidylprolyl isomerase [Flavobacteriales bacterium]
MSNVSKRKIRWQWSLTLAMTILCMPWLPVVAFGQAAQSPRRPLIEVRTNFGTMVVALYNETPIHRDNFLELVESGAYDSLLFHRIVPGFAVEGGDPASKYAPPGVALGLDPDSVGLPEEVVPGRIHTYGTLAAAAAGDTPDLAGRTHRMRFFFVLGGTYSSEELELVTQRNSANGRQQTYSASEREEYAEVGGQPRLDGAYTVFGNVVSGLEVLEALAALPCNGWDRPLQDQRMFMRRSE